MNYKETLLYLYAALPMYQRIGSAAFKKDLTNTLLLSEAAGSPHLAIKSIHIAGTNGKGTTSHLIAGMLTMSGYKVGLYTSPHYKDFRERIKINGTYISKKEVVDFVIKYKNVIEEIKPSFFEMTVVMAFKHFADHSVDFAVIETGLGGRLDSTNIITPIISVITNIGWDHQSILGDSLPLIAAEKAGIIKNNVPIVIGEYQDEVFSVFQEKAKETQSLLIDTRKDLSYDLINSNHPWDDTYNIYYKSQLLFKNLKTDFIAPYQIKNILTAIMSIKLLEQMGHHIDQYSINNNFIQMRTRTKYMGRWHILNVSPLTIADSAHNIDGIQYLLNYINCKNFRKIHIILGFVNDKDIHPILAILPIGAQYYYAKANIPRGLAADTLQTYAQSLGLKGRKYTNVKGAYRAAQQAATHDDLILIFGSIFIVAEVL